MDAAWSHEEEAVLAVVYVVDKCFIEIEHKGVNVFTWIKWWEKGWAYFG